MIYAHAVTKRPCHTINPDADQLEECLRIKLATRTIDERDDATLEQVYCCACNETLITTWQQRVCWQWLVKVDLKPWVR